MLYFILQCYILLWYAITLCYVVRLCYFYLQVTFIDFIVYPLWETWAELVYPAGQLMLDNIGKTREYWNAMIDPNSPPPSDDQEQDSSGDTDSTDQTLSQERSVETKHRENDVKASKTMKGEIVNSERRMSNGSMPLIASVDERASCTTSSDEVKSSSDPALLSSDLRRQSSETETSFTSSPVSERRWALLGVYLLGDRVYITTTTCIWFIVQIHPWNEVTPLI